MVGFQEFLEGWPYDAANNVRIAFGTDGREVLLARLPMGLELLRLEDRPDGRQVHGMNSLFDFHLACTNAAKPAAARTGGLGAQACADLFEEGLLYHRRLMLLVHLKDWARAELDTARNLRLIDFIGRHARDDVDRERAEQWRPEVARLNAIARAMLLLERCQYREALEIARHILGTSAWPADAAPDCGRLVAALEDSLRNGLALPPGLRAGEETLFSRHTDYWIIRHRGRTTCLKATRGLHCLAFLLRNPGREFHVSELLASLLETHVTAQSGIASAGDGLTTAGLYGGCPRLDAQAKTEYKCRLNELREELLEAEQLNDPARATKAREEMNVIAEHFASAVGLGGRDRKLSSEAERARSAVTKRIKESIQKITEAIPDLGEHLAKNIKTGYFCSYSPYPEGPVAWKF